MLCRFVSFLPLVLLSSLSGRADKPEPWNQFRGPNGSGIRSDARIHLPDKNNLLWQAPSPSAFPHPSFRRTRFSSPASRKAGWLRWRWNENRANCFGRNKLPKLKSKNFTNRAARPPPPRLSTRTGSSFILVPSGFFVTIMRGKRFGKSPSPPPRAFTAPLPPPYHMGICSFWWSTTTPTCPTAGSAGLASWPFERKTGQPHGKPPSVSPERMVDSDHLGTRPREGIGRLGERLAAWLYPARRRGKMAS